VKEDARMDTQKITLTITRKTLDKMKRIAALRQISISSLLTQMIEKLAEKEDGYALACQRQLNLLKVGFDLGFTEQNPTGRDELHQRS
jgi:hypothetical protein